MSLPIKVFTGKKDLKRAGDYLINYDIIEIPVTSSSTFDDVIQKCAVHCNILPLYVPLFAIWHTHAKSWKKPGHHIYPLADDCFVDSDGECVFEFRIRFLVRTELKVNGQTTLSKRWENRDDGTSNFIDKTVMDYLYRQKRDDVLKDNITLAKNLEDDIFSQVLGIAALDFICISKMMEQQTSLIGHIKVKSLLSKSFRQRLQKYNVFNRYQIKRQFRHFLDHLQPAVKKWEEDGRRIDFFQQRYLLNLEYCAFSYGVEKFNLARKGFITVSADQGITLHSDDENAEKWCDFSELTHMTLQVRCLDENGSGAISEPPPTTEDGPVSIHIVSISKFDGTVNKFSMESSTSAENLVSCIDGYYRLLVDAHHYLCKDVCSVSLIDHLSLQCHGPITSAYAEDLLEERQRKGIAHVGDCVIRQSRLKHDEYFANTIHSVHPKFETRNYKMDRSADGLLGLYGWEDSHKHETLKGLLEECAGGRYKGHIVPINADQIIAPKPKHKSNLIVRLCKDVYNDNYPGGVPQVTPRTVLMDLDNDESHMEVKILGTGMFTMVKRYVKHDNRYLVFKSIVPQGNCQQNHHIHKSFQESTSMLNCIQHQHFVQHIGMTMSHVTGIWLEYLPHESITTYLSEKCSLEAANRPSPSWFLQVLWQITHACHYLEEMSFAHGNLRGKNVLLQTASPQPHVKISDSGVRTRIRVHEGIPYPEAVLPAPWLAYEFCMISKHPDSGYPTVSADKWSFGATICEILNWGEIRFGPFYGGEMPKTMKEFYQAGDLKGCLGLPELITDNSELCELISKCWSVVPDRRPPFQQILREIGSALTGDYVLLSMTNEPVIHTIPEQFEVDLPTYEDEKLTRLSSLGQGHFGTVELYAYDRNRNGITEKVAVKEPLRPSMKQHKEFMQEIDTMKRINHPYIVRLLGVTEPSGRIVMEYMKNGSLACFLRNKLESRTLLPTVLLLRFCCEITEGMIALQEKRLVHRDLALRNILIGDGPGNMHVKISDFGLSRFVREGDNYYIGKIEEFPAKWYAPECLLEDPKRTFGFESDVWSYGVTVWEMFAYAANPSYRSLPPIDSRDFLDKLREQLRKGNRLMQTQYCPNEVYKIMMKCWAYDKHERLKFREIKVELDALITISSNGELTYLDTGHS